ncbi:MAG: UDP-N-acetylmuramoyl-tripeptide--D-alanyl-D-alanine ligase [Actinomycetota bacterium]|nr:UDP-N-acetylmuramoyl-tripeptide--D-alanyl-D-alanine ligase [Actinomycetota bacterium]
MSVAELASACGGTIDGPAVSVSGAAIDSRELRAGQLFVPIVADRDGHDFVPAALAAGAAAYLTSRAPVGGTAICVADTADALRALGVDARTRLGPRVVGITGSVGKTSTKDLLSAVLATTYRTAASPRSFNNELGLPITLLNAPGDAEAVVLEMGARGPGHVRELCAIGRPTVGIVVGVGAAHTGLFGGLDAVAEAKGELVEALPADGTAVLNADDRRVAAMAGRTRAAVLTFGTRGEVTATDVRIGDDLLARFVLHTPAGDADVRLAVAGEHQVTNALAAAAGAVALGVGPSAIAEGLGAARLSPWRMQLLRTPAGTSVLNDAYNANPMSVAAALRSLASLPARRRVAVLGLMAELGDDADSQHREMGALAHALGIEVVAVGTASYGPEPVADIDAALTALGALGPEDAVLVKGSRVVGLERLAARLVES